MRGVLHFCSRIGRMCHRGVVVVVHKRVRFLAVMLVLSLLIAALPAPSDSARAAKAASGVSEESLPVQFYRSMRTTVAAIGMWMAKSVRSRAAAPSTASTYEPVTAHLSPEPPFIDAPTGLTVTAAAVASLSLSWTAPAGSVDHYEIERSQSISGPFLFRANSATTTFNDTSVTTHQAYLYRVRAVTSSGLPSTPSNMALGTATTFEFSGVALTGKLGKKQHVYDIRTAINAVRTVAGLSAATWTRSDLTGLVIVANDVQELRNRLGEALTVLDISVGAYTDPTFTAGVSVIKATHFDQLQVRSTRGSSSSSGPIDPDSSSARLDPLNETGGGGENPLSRNFNWSMPLVGLPGRAGMDLGLTLSYNSLVWTKVNNSVSFDDDYGFPGPGFRLGFPVIQQPAYFNTEVGKQAYLMVGSDGSRRELRQVSTSGAGATLYEAADSSHALLDTTTTPFILRTSDGTQLRYELKGTEYQCTRITDRNGNYITINYTTTGRIAIDEIIDTLGRTIDFVYDANGWLTQIKQLWNAGAVTQYWGRFEYTDTTIDTNFPSLAVYGPADTMQIKTLSKVILPDNSYHQFSYTSWGQVWKITKFGSDNNPINYRSYDLPQTGATAHSDCPRFTTRKDWAKYWNGDTDGTSAAGEEATTSYIVPVSDSWTMPDNTPLTGVRAQVTTPDGTINKIYFVGTAGTATGWSRGLPILVDTVSGGLPQRRSVTTWTQDNTSVSYMLNPRVLETNVHDAAGNRARTQIVYQQFTYTNGTNCWYPRDVFQYAANGTTILRTNRTNYLTNAAYSDRRILGLPSEQLLYEGDVNASNPALISKVEFVYDEVGGFSSTEVPTVQHDSTNYSLHFVGRANVTKLIRHNVTASESTSISSKYNRAGAVVSAKDASDHETLISHADAFSDNVSRGTFAYATTVTDPGGNSGTAKFNFDFGAATHKQAPSPNPPAAGPQQTFAYDSIGRLQQVTNLVNNAYTRFEYSSGSELRTDAFETIQSASVEARSIQITDGAGRVIAAARQHPGSSGGYSGQRIIHDVMGRVFKTSNPTETSASGTPFQWNTAGDDASAGWIYTEQTYDWKGRALVTTNQDLTTRTASYSGCGCGGGSVVTLTDEGTIDPADHITPRKRQQKIYSDVLGRTVKTEMLNWENGSVYAATVNTYNARDQLTLVRRFAGPAPTDLSDLSCPSGTCQKSEMTYDGYGRLKTKHTPSQQIDPNNPASTDHVKWEYNSDDTIQQITDPRGTVSTFTHNSRHLVTGVSYSILTEVPTTGPSGVSAAASVGFTYDAAGNRKTMTDGMGDVEYSYDQLSRLTSETRHFTNLSGSPTGGDYTLTYTYNVANELTSITDPHSAQVNYNFDSVGRLSSLTGTGFTVLTFLSNIQYRAWGAPKSVLHGNGRTAATTYDSRLRIASYQLTIVPQDSLKLRNQYEYYADGRLKKMTDLDDTEPTIVGFPDTARHFSRIYDFDHAGRLTRAKGIKPNGVEEDRPFTQSYSYDAFDNLTNRSGKYYYQQPATSDSATFTNNRRQGSDYAADGQEIHSTGPGFVRDWSYDASGKMVQVKETVTATSQVSTYVTSYDGDGRQVREFLQEDATNSNRYMVRSTVLGGRVITRLNNAGNKVGTLIDVDSRITPVKIGSGPSGEVGWNHIDPRGLSEGGDTKAVYDPLGNRVAWQPVPTGPSPLTYPRSSSSTGGLGSLFGSAQDRGCVLNDRPISCQELNRQIWLGVVNVVGRIGVHPVEAHYLPLGILVPVWVEDNGDKLGEAQDDPDNNIIRINKDEDGKGHYEYYAYRGPILGHFLERAFEHVAKGYDHCMKSTFGEGQTALGTRHLPGKDAAGLTLAAGNLDADIAARVGGIFSQESDWELDPAKWGNDTGPMQLTGAVLIHWESLMVGRPFGDRIVRKINPPRAGLPAIDTKRDFNARWMSQDILDNMATGRNIVMSYPTDEEAARRYGPGPGAAREAYKDEVMFRIPYYRNFFNCLLSFK